ncbi:endospore germination permease [Paenibacillus filicis]|uniref:Endospore germination permease n=1 Tax=Paenibacillus filicis TaxID=669464 RepID=A0ABU9DID6_9BACL
MRTSANGQISVRQFTILIILGVIGDSILVLPTVIASFAKQDAWISMLIAGLLGVGTGWLYAFIASRMGRKSFVETAQSKLGFVMGTVIAALFLMEVFYCSITLISEVGQFLTTQMMPETPLNAVLVLFVFVVIVAYRYGIEAFARMGELLFPVFLALFLFLVIFLLPQVETSNLKPFMVEGMGPIAQGVLRAYVQGFTEMVILLMLTPYVKSGTKLTKPIVTGYAIGGLILFILIIMCVLVLGPNLMVTKYYPTFVLAQKITIGKFLERLEMVLTFLWIISVFFKTTMLYYGLTTGISQLLRLKESGMMTIPLGMILTVCTIISTPSITEYNQILIYYYPWFDIVFCVALPLLFLTALTVFARRKPSSMAGSRPNKP